MRWVGLLVALWMLVGCTTAVDGGGSVAPTASGGATSAPAEIVLPPRPREVRLDGVDPCSLLTEQQRAELGLDGKPFFSSALSALYSDGGEVPLCVVTGSEPRAVSVGVSVVTGFGIELFTSGKLAVEIRPVQVESFPSVVAVPRRFTDYCTVIVDVAPGQLLDVQFRDSGGDPVIPQDQLCQDAETATAAVVSTLVSIR